MTTHPRKTAVLGFLALSVLASGTCWLVQRVRADKPEAPEVKAPGESPAALDRHGFPLPAGAGGRLGSLAFRHEARVTALAHSPDGKLVATGDQDGAVRLWDAGTGREVRRLTGHLNPVVLLVFSPDGKVLASAEFNVAAVPQAAALGRRGVAVAAAGDNAFALAAEGPAPAEAAQKENGSVRLWDVASGKALHRFGGAANGGPFAAFSPDGAVLATRGTAGETVQLWDAATGKERRTLERLPHFPMAAAFVRNGKTLATVGNPQAGPPMMDNDNPPPQGALALWDAATGREKRVFTELAAANLTGATFAPDGRTFALISSDARTVQVWETATGKLRRTIKRRGPGEAATAPVYSPDGKYLALEGADRKVRIWNLVSDELELTIRVGPAGPRPPAFSPFAMNPFLPAPGAPVPGLPAAPGDDDAQASALAFAPDGKTLAVAGEGRVVRFWDLTTGQERLPRDGHRGDVGAVAVAPDGKLVATGGADKSIRLWDPARQQEVGQLRGHSGAVTFLAFSPDGKLLASGGPAEDVVRLWDVAAGKELRQFPAGTVPDLNKNLPKGAAQPGNVPPAFFQSLNEVRVCAAFTPDGQALVTRDIRLDDRACTGAVVFWEVATGKPLRRAAVFQVPLADVKKAADEAETPNRDPGEEPLADKLPPFHFAFALSADGKTLATAGSGAITLWDPATGKRLHSFPTAGEETPALLALSPDGKALAAVAAPLPLRALRVQKQAQLGVALKKVFPPDDENEPAAAITLYDVASGDELRELEGHDGPVHAVAFTSDGKRLVSGGQDRTMRLWDVATGKQLRHVGGHYGPVLAVAAAADDALLVSGGGDATALLWKAAELYRKEAPAGALPAKQADALWQDLGSSDAARAARALRTLGGHPAGAVALIRERLKPAGSDPAQAKRIAGWVADLESDKFPVRQKAATQLENCGELAEAALQKVLAGQPALETKQRVEQILKSIQEKQQSGEHMRSLRAVEVLEQLGTPEARQVLEALAKGAPDVQLTEEAKASLQRLGRRAAGP